MRNLLFTLVLHMFRLGKSPVPSKTRGTVLVMIDGLGYQELAAAIDKGYCPFFKKLFRASYQMRPYYCDPPASTVATEAELFYGNHGNIPGFTWYDRDLGRFVRGNRGADIDSFEKVYTKHIEYLKDGSCLLGVFSGGATQLNVSGKDLDQNNPFRIIRKLHILLFVLLNPIRFIYTIYLIAKSLVLSFVALIRKRSRHKVRQTLYDAFTRIFLGNITTYIAELELLRETPVLFLDYVLYDEFAHEYGLGKRTTLSSLRLINWYCESLYKMSKKTKRKYDFIILSDHGQTKSSPYEGLSSGKLEKLFERAVAPFKQSVIKTLGNHIRLPAHPHSIFLVPAGSTMQVYFSDNLTTPLYRDALNIKYPHLERDLLNDRQIGWLLVRVNAEKQLLIGKKGELHFQNGKIGSITGNPFPDIRLDQRILASLAKYASFNNNGDLVIFGNSTLEERVIAFEDHKGTHGGFVGDMTRPFIITKNRVVLDQVERDDHMNKLFQSIRSLHTVHEL